MYENELEIPGFLEGGGALQNKRHSMGEVWILSGNAQCDVWLLKVLVKVADIVPINAMLTKRIAFVF